MAELTLRDVMTRDFVGVSESDTVHGAVTVMRKEGVQDAVVLRGREPVGTITAGDILDLLVEGKDTETTTVDEVMQRDVPTLGSDAALGDVATKMLSTNSDLILVANNDDVLGVITASELARYTWGRPDGPEAERAVEENVTNPNTTTEEGYSNQSICEACGSLSRDLVNVNGQLLCPDCREM
ncbi:CBS domain [Halanaeroarchaeum sp. HSR-CO]|uniref:CBS domain-containing protein n=1 Tax=Halanaeroarchaeum sp. HSR-CO TaxID=2866382 RepID=UPI00217F09FF|nr:CBS domain-containing protein [Halanaeroarchaeum sp. HSR-CO]UWG48330.1 CBS domain [Halanaeroarchaeum sp. HSR-CO]